MSKAEKKFLDFVNEKSEYNPNYSDIQGKMNNHERVKTISQPQTPKGLSWRMFLIRIVPVSLVMLIVIIGSTMIIRSMKPSSSDDPVTTGGYEYQGSIVTDYIANSSSDFNTIDTSLTDAMYTPGLYLYELEYLNTDSDYLIVAYLANSVINEIDSASSMSNIVDGTLVNKFYQSAKEDSNISSKIKWYQFKTSDNIPVHKDDYQASGVYLIQTVELKKELITNNDASGVIPYIDIQEYQNSQGEYLKLYRNNTKKGTYIEILNERLINKDSYNNSVLNDYLVTSNTDTYEVNNNQLKITTNDVTFDSAFNQIKIEPLGNGYYYDQFMSVLNTDVLKYRTANPVQYTRKVIELNPEGWVTPPSSSTYNVNSMVINNSLDLLQYMQSNSVNDIGTIFPLSIDATQSGMSLDSILGQKQIIFINVDRYDENGFSGENLDIYTMYELNGKLNIILTYTEGSKNNSINKCISIALDKNVDISNINVEIVNGSNSDELAKYEKNGFE